MSGSCKSPTVIGQCEQAFAAVRDWVCEHGGVVQGIELDIRGGRRIVAGDNGVCAGDTILRIPEVCWRERIMWRHLGRAVADVAARPLDRTRVMRIVLIGENKKTQNRGELHSIIH